MSTVLVTGGSGFTGRYLIRELKSRGCRVVALSSQPCDADAHLSADLLDRSAIESLVLHERPDRVVHLAALSFVGHPNPLDFYRVNVLGTETLLAALAMLPRAPRVLLCSSANVYGANASGVVDEGVMPAPVNHYAASKLAMEHLALNWASQLPILIARPFNYTGPGQATHFLIPKIVEHFRQRRSVIELGNLDVSRDFSDVRDMVGAYAGLVDRWPTSAASGDVFNVCSGKATPLRWLLEQLELLAGYQIEVKVNPEYVRRDEIPSLCGDPARLEGWGCLPSRRPLAQTLRDMLEGGCGG